MHACKRIVGILESSGAGNSPQGAAASRKNLMRNMTGPGWQDLEQGSGRSDSNSSGHSPVANISLNHKMLDALYLHNISTKRILHFMHLLFLLHGDVLPYRRRLLSGHKSWREASQSTGLPHGIVRVLTCGASLSATRSLVIGCWLTPEHVSQAVTHRVGLCPTGGSPGLIRWSRRSEGSELGVDSGVLCGILTR